MGRGRQKAKQAKVARKLKYTTTDTDFAALQRELSTGARAGADVEGLDRADEGADPAAAHDLR